MKNILIILFILFCGNITAQNTQPINTDRPDQSDGTYVLPKNNLQIENGFTISNKTFVNNLMLRYGITKSTEIRLLADVGKFEDDNALAPITISAKQRIIQNKGIVPAITLVGYLRYEKIASKLFQNNTLSYNFLLAFENDITDKFSIGYNIGTSKGLKNISFTTSVGYSFTNKITGFLEYFSNYIKDENPSHNIDGGILYLINNRLQFDAALGISLTEKNSCYLTTGFSYRFNK